VKDARDAFLPTFSSRLFAALFVIVLIGSLSLISILGIAIIGPAVGHGTNVDHAAGKIVEVGPGRDFVLLTETGQRLAFQCGNGCRASLAHLQRHLREHAHTDVYYVAGTNKTLMALDVD
jgi:hypothetical protein